MRSPIYIRRALIAFAFLGAATPALAAPEAVILYDWVRHPAKTTEPPAGVMRIAERLDVTFDSRRDGEWTVEGDVQTWKFSIRVPGASSVAADFGYDAVPGAVLAVADEHLIRSETRYISAHSGAETISFQISAPADGAQPSVRINSLRIGDPKTLAKDGDIEDEYVPYLCHANANRDLAARATPLVCIDGHTCCSSVLINNTADNGDPKRYLLTAEHCQSEQFDGSLAEPSFPESAVRVFWGFSDACGSAPRDFTFSYAGPKQTGGRHVAEWKDLGDGTTSRGDLWLLELSIWPPAAANARLSGFDARDGAQAGAICSYRNELGGSTDCDDSYYVDGDAEAEGTVYGVHYGGLRPLQFAFSPTHFFGHPSFTQNPDAIASANINTVVEGSIGDLTPGSSGSGLFTMQDRYFAVCSNDGGDGTLYWTLGGAWSKWGVGDYLRPGDASPTARVLDGLEAPLPLPVPQFVLSSTRSALTLGESTTLSWTAQDADSCVASGAWTGAQPVSGQVEVVPAAAGQVVYTLTCSNAEQSASRQTVVTVSAASDGGGGGGGSFGWISLVAIGLGVLRRRCHSR